MANKYNNHFQASKEEMAEQKRLLIIKNIQKQQQQINSEPVHYLPKTYYNSNFHKLVLKSTLNPNAKEFFPSYTETPKNGYTHPINNIISISDPDYHYGISSNYECERRLSGAGKYVQGQVQRSNTVLPLVMENYGVCSSSTVDSQSISFQETTSNDNKNKLMTTDIIEGIPPTSGSDILKSGENVWFIEKRIETSQENSTEWTCQEETEENYSKEEYYDPKISLTDATSIEQGNDKKSFTEEENKHNLDEGSNTARKKLIMLYPTKKQNENITEGSQESIFENPNIINYTSDESFLTQNNANPCYNDDVYQIITKGKQFYTNADKTSNDVLDEFQDLSEDFERTAKQSDSKSYEIEDRDTSKCALVQTSEKQPARHKVISKPIEMATLKKPKSEKTRKIQNFDISEKDASTQKVSTSGKESKVSKATCNFTTLKKESGTPNKLLRIGVTPSKSPGGITAIKAPETITKAAGKTSTTGAIPKTKEIAMKSMRKCTINNDSGIKSARNNQKTLLTKKEEKDIAIRSQRPINDYGVPRKQDTVNARRIDAGSNNNQADVKSIGKAESSQKKLTLTIKTRSKSSERKPIATKTSNENPLQSKYLTQNPSTNVNNPIKKNVSPTPVRERLVLKSVIKTQMRSATNLHPPSQTKKIIVINNAPKKEKESKKTKPNTIVRNTQDKANKVVALTKIPVRQKSTSLKRTKVGSDGDNAKIRTSKSCGGRKNFTERTSRSSIRIGDKLSENKNETPSREIANSTRNSSLKRQTLDPK